MVVDVLIVDDSAATRKILQRVLRQAQVPLGQVYEAGDGLEALEILKAAQVTLILAEINMPNMDGLELLGQIKAHPNWKNVPVVIVSTEGGRSKVMEAVRLGAAAYVRKPFNAEQIRQTLSRLL